MAEVFSLLTPALVLLALLAYTRPPAAIVLLSALLPTYLLRLNIAGIPTTFLEVAIAVTFAAGAAQHAVRREWYSVWRRLPRTILAAVALFVVAAVVATIVSPHLRTSLGILKGWVAAPLIFGWLAATASSNARLRKNVQAALLASGTMIALLGLVQLKDLSRIRSVYDVPNSLALFLAPLLVLAWWQKKRAVTVILAVALVATLSFAATAAVSGALILGYLLWPQRKTQHARAALIFFIVATGFYTAATGRLAYIVQPILLGQGHSSITVRQQLWSIATELIYEHPITGVGLGTFEPAYQQKLHQRFAAYRDARQSGEHHVTEPLNEFVFRDPHNWLLSFWLNTGLLGLLSFITLHGVLFKNVYHLKHTISPAGQALFLSILTLLLFGLVDTIYWKNDLAALHWLLIGLLLNQISVDRIQYQKRQDRQHDTEQS